MNSCYKPAECEINFRNRFSELKKQLKSKKRWLIYEYVLSLEKNLSSLLTSVSEKNFWYIFPKILGIDAKVNLLESLINLSTDFCLSEEELIQLVESDYRQINKENYVFGEESSKSIIFCVE